MQEVRHAIIVFVRAPFPEVPHMLLEEKHRGSHVSGSHTAQIHNPLPFLSSLQKKYILNIHTSSFSCARKHVLFSKQRHGILLQHASQSECFVCWGLFISQRSGSHVHFCPRHRASLLMRNGNNPTTQSNTKCDTPHTQTLLSRLPRIPPLLLPPPLRPPLDLRLRVNAKRLECSNRLSHATLRGQA